MKEEDKEEDSEEKEEEASEEEEAHRHMTDATSVTNLDTLQRNVESESSTGDKTIMIEDPHLKTPITETSPD